MIWIIFISSEERAFLIENFRNFYKVMSSQKHPQGIHQDTMKTTLNYIPSLAKRTKRGNEKDKQSSSR